MAALVGIVKRSFGIGDSPWMACVSLLRLGENLLDKEAVEVVAEVLRASDAVTSLG